jgi:hypothetical protein
VWAPGDAGTCALIDVSSTIVVSVLLSREYPMAVTGSLEHVAALADS